MRQLTRWPNQEVFDGISINLGTGCCRSGGEIILVWVVWVRVRGGRVVGGWVGGVVPRERGGEFPQIGIMAGRCFFYQEPRVDIESPSMKNENDSSDHAVLNSHAGEGN